MSLSEAIRRKVELEWGTEDNEYLDKVERNLKRALQEHPPDVMLYNAGTDILEGDRLGGLSISPQVCPGLGGGGGGGMVCSEGSTAAGHRWTTLVLLLMDRNRCSPSRARPAAEPLDTMRVGACLSLPSQSPNRAS